MSSVVLDASALLAMLLGEPGGEKVKAAGMTAMIRVIMRLSQGRIRTSR